MCNDTFHVDSCLWDVTNKCNLNCIHCVSAYSFKNSKDINTTQSLNVIENLSDIGCKNLLFSGGEPLIRKDIFEIFRKCFDKKINVHLITNGTLINDKNIKNFSSKISSVGVSIDGSTPEINDRIRGNGTFIKITKAIDLLRKHGVPTSLYYTVCKLNIDDIHKIVTYAKSRDLKINIKWVIYDGRAKKNRGLLYYEAESEAFQNILSLLLDEFNLNESDVVFDDSCGVNLNNIFLSPNGYIYPCIDCYQSRPDYNFGNILKIDTEKIAKYNKILIEKTKTLKCSYKLVSSSQFSLVSSKRFPCTFLSEVINWRDIFDSDKNVK